MTEIKDGGPALPLEYSTFGFSGNAWQRTYHHQKGLSLRDYLAAHETSFPPTSWVQSKYGSQIEGIWELNGVEMSECLSEWRYQMADAMLKKRGE